MDNLLNEFASELRENYDALMPDLACWRAQPHDSALRNAIFRFLHSAKGGAGFVRMARIEQLAAAAETALDDLRRWDLPADAPQIDLILVALERINAIAEAIEMGIGLPALGEEAMADELSGHRRIHLVTEHPYDPQQISTIRLPLSTVDHLVADTESLHAYVVKLGDTPLPSALALLRNDMARHVEAVNALRYVPAAHLFAGLETYTASLVADRDQPIDVHVIGDDVPVDRAALPILRNALCHLLRNAVAHGIEPPEVRSDRGKPTRGCVTMSAVHAKDALTIEVADDGGGVDYAALVANADVQAFAHTDMLELIQCSGVTAAQNVSALAGRGVGLDCVRIALERLDGRLDLFDRAQQGFTARLHIPHRGLG